MTRTRRLLTVSNFFDSHRGGLEIVAGRLARELAGRDFEVTWLAGDVTPPPPANAAVPLQIRPVKCWNVTERRLGVPWPVLSPRAVRTLWRAVREADVVLLHDSLYMTSIVTSLAARTHRKPLVVIQHIGAIPYRNPLLRGLMAVANRAIARPVLRGADQVVFISQFVREFFARVAFRAPPELVFNGVDTQVFRPACGGEKAQARQALGLGGAGTVALFVGRFVEKKGVDHLHRAAAMRPDVTFAFAGWGVLDPRHWNLPNVRVFSELSGRSLATLYQASDVFVLPSQGEGFPLVVQEALACGLPVICGAECLDADTEAAALLSGVDIEGRAADLVAADLAGEIDRLSANVGADASHRHCFARRRYAWSASADRYAEILHRVIDGSSGAPQ